MSERSRNYRRETDIFTFPFKDLLIVYEFEKEVDKADRTAQREYKAGRVESPLEDTKQIWNR